MIFGRVLENLMWEYETVNVVFGLRGVESGEEKNPFCCLLRRNYPCKRF
jgi:hypothetical protein